MKKRIYVLCVILIFTMTAFAGCGGVVGSEGGAATSTDTITWKVQGYTAAGTLYDEYGKNLAERITKMSGGRLKIEFYSADSIVSVGENPTAVRDGILDAEFGYAGLWSGIDEALPLFCSTPGLFSDPMDMVTWINDGGGLEIWQGLLDDAGMNCKVLLAGAHDMEDFLWSNKKIQNIEDLKGLTIRMMPVAGTILADNGMSVAFVSGTEVVSSMERKVIDAGEYSIPALDKTFGFQDVAKYVMRPGWHQPCATQELVINKDSWEALPDDLKLIVEEACKANIVEVMTDCQAKDIEALEYFQDNGIEIVQLSEEMVKTLDTWSTEWFEKKCASSESFKKVRQSQEAFIKSIAKFKDERNMPYPDWAYEE